MSLPTFDRSRLMTDDDYLDESVRRALQVRELDYRQADNLEVRLLWDRVTDTCYVTVHENEQLVTTVEVLEGEKALDVFQHPFAYSL